MFELILGNFEEVILEGTTLLKSDASEFEINPEYINGLTSHVVEIRENIPVEKSQVCLFNVFLMFCLLKCENNFPFLLNSLLGLNGRKIFKKFTSNHFHLVA